MSSPHQTNIQTKHHTNKHISLLFSALGVRKARFYNYYSFNVIGPCVSKVDLNT